MNSLLGWISDEFQIFLKFPKLGKISDYLGMISDAFQIFKYRFKKKEYTSEVYLVF